MNEETQQQVCTDDTQEKYIVSIVDRYTEAEDKLIFYDFTPKNLEPGMPHFTEKPGKAHLFDTEKCAYDFIEMNNIDGRVHKVTVTVDTSEIDRTIPTTVKVGSLINLGKDEYKIKKIGNQVVELEEVARDKYGNIVSRDTAAEISGGDLLGREVIRKKSMNDPEPRSIDSIKNVWSGGKWMYIRMKNYKTYRKKVKAMYSKNSKWERYVPKEV